MECIRKTFSYVTTQTLRTLGYMTEEKEVRNQNIIHSISKEASTPTQNITSDINEFKKRYFKRGTEFIPSHVTFPKTLDDLKEIISLELQTKYDFSSNALHEMYGQTYFEIPSDSICHSGYLEYLIIAWNNRLGIHFSPHILYEIIFQQIKRELNRYAKDQNSSIKDFELNNISTYSDVDKLYKSFDIKESQSEIFIPKFSKSSKEYRCNLSATFHANKNFTLEQDIVLSGCIPKIIIHGNTDDWLLLLNMLGKIKGECIHSGLPSGHIDKYISGIDEIIQNINNPQYWQEFFYVKVVRLSEELESSPLHLHLRGHIIKYISTTGVADINTYFNPFLSVTAINRLIIPDLLNVVETHNDKENGIEYTLLSGLMYSMIQDDVLIPQYFNNVVVYDKRGLLLDPVEIENRKILVKYIKFIKFLTEKDYSLDNTIDQCIDIPNLNKSFIADKTIVRQLDDKQISFIASNLTNILDIFFKKRDVDSKMFHKIGGCALLCTKNKNILDKIKVYLSLDKNKDLTEVLKSHLMKKHKVTEEGIKIIFS